MSEWIDISIPLRTGMIAWPGSPGLRLSRLTTMDEGAVANGSFLETDVHIGTHIDAPWHSIPNGATIEKLPLDALIGPAYVVDVGTANDISARLLDQAAIPPGTERLLFRSVNSKLWNADPHEFKKDYVALTDDAASWVVRRGIRLVGIDYLSIQQFSDSMVTHNILLEQNIVIVEGLNLTHAPQGRYDFICLPLLLVGSEGSPARAVLRPATGGGLT
jgi:arylformamidase